ncbi:CotH kinase family protein [Aurantibacter sp.]|uniref:CotH kinase family protein n=1 Tax=Aurantibacter sp. TaxID=2807103 RepID=UPI0032642FF0
MIAKKLGIYLIPTLFLCFSSTMVFSQKIKARKGSFGIDKSNKIIVWHHSKIDTISFTSSKIKGFKFGNSFKVLDTISSLAYSKEYKVSRKGNIYSLYISKLPLVQVKVRPVINENTKVLGRYKYFNDNNYIKSSVGIEYRGNLSLTYPKKTYDLEFWADSIKNKSKDLKFKDLRDDDDWILDGLYNEPLRIRSYMANKLWLSLYKPSYQTVDKEAKSGIDAVFVEVFKNNKYQGIHTLSESVDRKLLNLKRNNIKNIQGELFKASSYEGAPAFIKAPEFNNLFPHWGGFEMVFPIVDYESHWDNLADFVDLVVNGKDTDFAQSISEKIDINNTIDYFLFVNLLRATDNLGKNYYLARYDENGAYFFIPWDLDGIMGIIQDGKRIVTTDDILSNGLFDRLLEVNPDEYKSKIKSRWKALRKSDFSDGNLLGTIETLYSKLQTEKVYEREHLIWPSEKSVENDYEYLETWLKNRLVFLDAYFKNLE